MEVVQVLLKIALSAKSDGTVVQITHRALILFGSWRHQSWGGM
jgi:hypothetical protein